MKILITGANGFIGRNLTEQLKNEYEILSPTHEQLDLMNMKQVETYLINNKFDIIIHAANVNTTSNTDIALYKSLSGNLTMFFNLERCKDYYNKMYYFGSGAEYDMKNYIPDMTEEYFGKFIPSDPYGFSKYIMAKTCEQNNNIYDLVLFGVYGKYEEWGRRFISNNIYRNLQGLSMTIKRNMFFDYIYIDDLIHILRWFIENQPKNKRYNICRGEKIDLISLTEIINKKMNTKTNVIIAEQGLKREYTGNNRKFVEETKWNGFISFENSIGNLISYYEKII